MKTINTIDPDYIHPENADNLRYWSRKWGVSTKQLTGAILDMGTLETRVIKEYLRRDNYIYHPLEGAKFLFKKTVSFIF